MTYYVKLCGRCKTANEPSMTYCGKCGADLPSEKIESDVKAIQPPAYAVQAVQQENTSRQADLDANFGVRPSIDCKIVDVEIPFVSMVSLMVKLVLASIPALIILSILSVFVFGLLSASLRH